MTDNNVYLDSNATTSIGKEVLDLMHQEALTLRGNAAASHLEGERAASRLEWARQSIATVLGVTAEEIVFTSGGTEANNMVLYSAALGGSVRPSHVVVSAIEHSSILQPVDHLERSGMLEVTRVPVKRDGVVSPRSVMEALRPETELVSVMLANNETGALQPIAQIGDQLRRHPALFHVDAVAALGKVPIDLRGWSVDACSGSAHKFHGPQGVGFLFRRQGVRVAPLILGGGHEGGLRAGTPNVVGAMGMAAALRSATTDPGGDLCHLRDLLFRGIASSIRGVLLNTPLEAALPNTLNLSFQGIKGDALVHALDGRGVTAATGSACHSSTGTPSHVLIGMQRTPEQAQGAIRFSLEGSTTEEEIRYVLSILPGLVGRLRDASLLPKPTRGSSEQSSKESSYASRSKSE